MLNVLKILSSIPEKWNDDSSLIEFNKINNVKVANFEELILCIGEAIESAININPELCKESITRIYNLTGYGESNLHRLIADIAKKYLIIASRTTSFDDLPVEMKLKIAALLPQIDLKNFYRTCHSNRSIAVDIIIDKANSGTNLSDLEFENVDQAINFSIRHKLRAVNLRGFRQINDFQIQKLTENYPQLYLLSLELSNYHGESLTDVGLAHLAKLQALKNLSLWRCKKITDSGLAHLAKLQALKKLGLWYCKKITDIGLVHLAALQGLESLVVIECEKITNKGLVHLAALPNLQFLMLNGCDKISDDGLASLVGLQRLEVLCLRRCNQIKDNGVMHLAAFQALVLLDLSGCIEITDNGLIHLVRLQALKVLLLNDCKEITDNGLAHLASLPGLQILR